jgi:hypothetical protein
MDYHMILLENDKLFFANEINKLMEEADPEKLK